MGSDSTIPTSKLLKSADGTQIYADAIGNPANPAVVFIHGFSLSSSAFDLVFNDQKWTKGLYLVSYLLTRFLSIADF